jgi:hypothetical protein
MKNYNKMEKNEASRDGAKVVKNSGRGLKKGDAVLDNLLIDYKFNEKSFALTPKNWRKHYEDSIKENFKDPVIVVCFADGTKLAIADWELIKEWKKAYDIYMEDNNE